MSFPLSLTLYQYPWKSSRAATIFRSAAVCGAPAAARRNRQRFWFHCNPLCHSCPLRLVPRTQPRAFGCGSAAQRRMPECEPCQW